MIERTQLLDLYCKRRLSMMQIATHLGVTHATVLYWLKKHEISRRSWSESSYVKLNPRGDPFSIRSQLTNRQRELTAAGLLLYWAEGKKPGGAIQIGNLDARMLQLFLKFLREVCRINESRLRVYVRVYQQFSLKAAQRYWARRLTLPTSRVLVYPHTDRRSDHSKQWSKHGIATLQFNSTKLKEWLQEATEQYLQSWVGIRSDGSSRVAEPEVLYKVFTSDIHGPRRQN